jgi:hypothetical protein
MIMGKSKTKAEQLTFWPHLGLPDKERRKPSAQISQAALALSKSQQPPLGPTQKVKAQCQS